MSPGANSVASYSVRSRQAKRSSHCRANECRASASRRPDQGRAMEPCQSLPHCLYSFCTSHALSRVCFSRTSYDTTEFPKKPEISTSEDLAPFFFLVFLSSSNCTFYVFSLPCLLLFITDLHKNTKNSRLESILGCLRFPLPT